MSELGIGAGERVVLYIPNGPQWVVSWLGTLRLGAVAVPITPIYTVRDLNYIANDSGASAIVCTDTNYGYVTQVLDKTNIRRVIATNVADLLPGWKRRFGELFDRIPKGRIAKNGHTVPFLKLIRAASRGTTEPVSSGDGNAEILYTGGTTKHPKGVPITHRLFLESAEAQLEVAEPLIPRGQNIVLQGSPLFHILGQIFGLGALLLFGDTLILLPKINLDGMMDAIGRYKARSIFGVPALYRMILEHDRLGIYNLSSLRYCFSGGDVLPQEILRRWQKSIGMPIYQGYGSTETVGGVSMSPTDRESGSLSMGKVLPKKTVKIVEPDTLKETEPAVPGELLVHSDPMVTAYWNKPDETLDAFVELDGRLYYRTGDIVSTDEDGYLHFVDRTADTIKHKGYRVSASEIEAVLQEHPAVVGSCVIGVPDRVMGERIKAMVILKEDVKGITGYDLIKWCRSRLASYKVPQYIEFRDMLPKSKVGKLLRREVRSGERKRIEKGKWDEALES